MSPMNVPVGVTQIGMQNIADNELRTRRIASDALAQPIRRAIRLPQNDTQNLACEVTPNRIVHLRLVSR
jgi:hypothetical protein